jgi:hypothetical protein
MIYKLALSAGAAATSVSLDIREDDTITAMLVSNTAGAAVEVSFGSVSSFLTNDSTSSLMTILGGVDLSISDLKIPVQAGERLYLHSAAGTGDCVAMIYTTGDRQAARPAVRRR